MTRCAGIYKGSEVREVLTLLNLRTAASMVCALLFASHKIDSCFARHLEHLEMLTVAGYHQAFK